MSGPPREDDEFDAQFAALGPVEPPPHLVAATLARVDELRARVATARADAEPAESPTPPRGARVLPFRRPARAWWVGGSVTLAAAAAWLLLPAAPVVGDPANFVAKGGGEASASLDLRAVVRTPDGRSERVIPGARYAPGDTLHFRVSASERMSVRLRREDTLVWAGEIGPTPLDLPAAWVVESGESPGRFVLEGEGVAVELPVGGAGR